MDGTNIHINELTPEGYQFKFAYLSKANIIPHTGDDFSDQHHVYKVVGVKHAPFEKRVHLYVKRIV
jgi:hypothetical protein